jgi:hypothetical protein
MVQLTNHTLKTPNGQLNRNAKSDVFLTLKKERGSIKQFGKSTHKFILNISYT